MSMVRRQRRSSQRQRRLTLPKDRVTMIHMLFIAVAVTLSFRLFWVQVISHRAYAALAENQHETSRTLYPERGKIFAHDQFAEDKLALVAGSRTLYEVYLNPAQSQQLEESAEDTVDILVRILQVDGEVMRQRIAKEKDGYEPVKHGVTEPEIEALRKEVEEKKIKAIHWAKEDARWYPEAGIMSALTGFVGYVSDEKKGQYGLEGYFHEDLSGTEGSFSAELDQGGRYIAAGQKDVVDAQDGDMLILTIDRNIQYKACTELANAVEKFQAKRGSVIVMNPKTGAIMAMCSAPSYDANAYSKVEDVGAFQNHAISYVYEPGSVMKAMAIAAAVNEGKVTPYTTYDDVGKIMIQGHDISNYSRRSYGTVDMITVLKESLNLGTVFAIQKVGNEKWLQYVEAFGFGKKTGITLAGEQAGTIEQVKKKQDVYTATSSFGQGMTSTALQMTQAYAALANGGVMMKPYIVEQQVDAQGFQHVTDPMEVGRPVTPETARTLSAMLVTVVDEGHSKGARVSGYAIAGKTGTAQVAREDGLGYDANRHRDSFIGFGPVSDPQFVVSVFIDEPQGVATAEYSAVPVAGAIHAFLVNYLKIPPDRK